MRHSFKHKGISYSKLSDRGRQIKQEIRRTKMNKTSVLVSSLLSVGLVVATHGIAA